MLLADLSRGDGVVLFCPEPFQAPAAWAREHRLLPIADLLHERARGAVSAPVYLVDGGAGEEAFARVQSHVPGAVVDARTEPDAAMLRAAAAAVREPVRPVTNGPSVEAMVLAYKSKDYIAPCLQSLLDQDWPDLKITVLDNASGDGTGDFVRAKFPSIEVLDSEENLGFAAGHNVLFARSTADHVVLLNHDAIARRDFVRELVAAAQALPNGAAFGAKMLMRRCPTIVNSTGIVMNESGFAADRDIGKRDVGISQAPERVFAVCGGAMLLRGSVLREIGGFDPTFFMYVEDVDWCWRARIAGHEAFYVPSAVCVHDWHGDMAAAAGASKAKAPQSEDAKAELEGRRRFMVERNRLLAVRKNYDGANLKRVWRGLLEHDRQRREALADHVARGGGPLPKRVLQAIDDAHAYFRKKRFALWLLRRRTQKLRRVADATFTGLLVPGFGEPSGVGDLHAIVDRYCASARQEIVMATADAGSLGTGWHHAEPSPDGKGGQRWSMAECWFYLRSDAPVRGVQMTVQPQPLDSWAELQVDGIVVQRLEVARGVPHRLEWTLPRPAPANAVVECRVRCGAFVPAKQGMGGDTRELGLYVASIRAV